MASLERTSWAISRGSDSAMDIDEHDMGAEAFALEPGGECGIGRRDLVACLLEQDPLEDIGDLAVGVDNQHAGVAAGDPVHGDVVGLHEAVELGHGDPSVLGAGDPVALELARIEPL